MSSNSQGSPSSSQNGRLTAHGEDYAKCWCCRRSTFRLSVYIVFLIAYLCGGALCFMWIESPYENRERELLRTKRNEFLKRHPCVSEAALESFIGEIVHASERGVSASNNATVSESNWSFGQSIFFSTTVVTTVGYGRTAPLSRGGRLFCIFFALVGIPLTLILFTAIIERLMVLSRLFVSILQRKLPDTWSDFHIRIINLSIVLFVHVAIFTLIPAAIFDWIEEGWTYLDSVYFCFISWTTVGLGDYVPGEQVDQRLRPLYKILSSAYLFVSLISIFFLLKTFHDTPHLNLGLRIYMYSDRLDEERLALRPGDRGPKYTRQVDEVSSSAPRRASVQSAEDDLENNMDGRPLRTP